MAKSNAERQKEYRASRPTAGKDGQRQLNAWVDTSTALALTRLSKRYSVTKQEMISRLIQQADETILAGIESESAEWDAYFDVKSVTQ